MTKKENYMWASTVLLMAALLILIICIGTGRSLWLSAPVFTAAAMFFAASVTDEDMRKRFEFWRLKRRTKHVLRQFKRSQHSAHGFVVCRNRLCDIFIEQAETIGIDRATAYRAFWAIVKDLKGRRRASWQ